MAFVLAMAMSWELELHKLHSLGGFILESMDSYESGNRVASVIFQLILEWEDGFHLKLVLVVGEVAGVLLPLGAQVGPEVVVLYGQSDVLVEVFELASLECCLDEAVQFLEHVGQVVDSGTRLLVWQQV